jgi:hypothetical protein
VFVVDYLLLPIKEASVRFLSGPSLVNGTLSIIYLNKGEPEGSSKHSPSALEPNSQPLEFLSLHDLAFWI